MNEPGSHIDIQAAVANDPEQPFTTTNLMLRAPGPDELLVKVVATGICHTDVMTKAKGLCEFPIVLGHEGVGVVERVGESVSGFAAGDHVIMTYDYCGDCAQCDTGKPSYCFDHGSLNFAGTRPNGERTHHTLGSAEADVHGSFFQQSSFATHALAHVTNTVKVDPNLPLATLAPLGCGVQTGAGTVFNTLEVSAGSTIAIFGNGCVGLSAVMAANVAGASTIIAVDLNASRLDMALELGATHVLNPADFADGDALLAAVGEIAPTGCNYSIDTTGNPTVLRQAFDSCGPLGVTAMIAPGVPGTEVTIEMMGLLPGKSLRGVVQGDSQSKTFIPHLIDLWQDGKFPFDKLVTMFDSIDSVDDAVNAMSSGDVIKPVVVIDGTLHTDGASQGQS